MTSFRATGALLLMAALTLVACNLTRAVPTPTYIPPTATFVPSLNLPSGLTPVVGTAIPPNPNCATTPQGWIPYVVEQGDSLGLLAEQTDSTIADIQNGNCMSNADSLLVDTTIYLPRQPVIGQ
jgi:hypothetical protein